MPEHTNTAIDLRTFILPAVSSLYWTRYLQVPVQITHLVGKVYNSARLQHNTYVRVSSLTSSLISTTSQLNCVWSLIPKSDANFRMLCSTVSPEHFLKGKSSNLYSLCHWYKAAWACNNDSPSDHLPFDRSSIFEL